MERVLEEEGREERERRTVVEVGVLERVVIMEREERREGGGETRVSF